MQKFNFPETYADHLAERKNKVCFLKYMVDVTKRSKDFWAQLPRDQWINFSDIPGELFHSVFEYIDKYSHVELNADYTQFIIRLMTCPDKINSTGAMNVFD
jgi:hypothetical protein